MKPSILDSMNHCPKCFIAMVFEFKVSWKLKRFIRWRCLECNFIEDER